RLVLPQWRRLGDPRHAEVSVDRDAGDEGVVADARQRLRREPHVPRHARGDVENRVELPSPKPREIAVAVADDPLHLGKELRVRQAPVEERDLVPARERSLDDLPAEEAGAAEDEELQSSPRAASSRSTSSAVL